MMTTDNKNNVDKIIDVSVRASLKSILGPSREPKKPVPSVTSEAYIAEPKHYGLVTDFLSQRAKDSHSELYKDYVESLNRISAELDGIDRSEVNSRHSTFRSAKLDETFNLNAVWLHELFFANCFDVHSEVYMDSKAYIELERTWGTFDAWQKDFMACALCSGNGWVICGYHLFLKRYINVIISNNSQDIPVGLYPVIVTDMHEHVYSRDYLNDKRSYLLAMMKQFNWTVIDERFERCSKIATALR
jgi:Fe-Mn family superoxide dismutase